jgi:Reverse transcriptase (RNA-dependent DNA polymerase)
MDDIIIHSSTFAEHITHLRIVSEVLNSANLLINPEKCEFSREEIIIMGYLISETGICLAKDRLLTMDTWK